MQYERFRHATKGREIQSDEFVRSLDFGIELSASQLRLGTSVQG